MSGTIIFLLSIDNNSAVPECGCNIVLRRTRAAGNDNFGASRLQDRAEYCCFRFNMQAHTNGKSGEWLRLAKLCSQPLQEPLMELCPADFLVALLH